MLYPVELRALEDANYVEQGLAVNLRAEPQKTLNIQHPTFNAEKLSEFDVER